MTIIKKEAGTRVKRCRPFLLPIQTNQTKLIANPVAESCVMQPRWQVQASFRSGTV